MRPRLAVVALVLLAGCGGDPPPHGRPALLVSGGESHDNAVYTMALDGSDLHRIATGYGARWAPDGRRVALLVNDVDDLSRPVRLGIADADGRHLRLLPTLAPLGSRWQDPQYVAWSPDGRRLAFIRPLRTGEEPPFGLFTVQTDGTGLRLVVRSGHRSWYLTDPAWSPDGRRIGFTRGETRIDSVRADGTHLRVLYGRPSHAIVGGLAWSPDGRRIGFEVEDPEGERSLCVMRLGSGRQTRIGEGSRLVWSPDGRRIAAVTSTGGSGVILSAPDGSHRRFVPVSGATDVDWR